ncbi:MAG: nickel pincer cofactor biosynthesis protein LarB [Phycisphaerales bacterium]|nr:nickel pincer cofactor biosynthesis protein LarB [Phycisphaerales bacterium]
MRALLQSLVRGETTLDAAVSRLRDLPFEDIGFARVDHHRALRCGFAEVILCPGKTVEQVTAIFTRCAASGGNVLATRATHEVFEAIRREHPTGEYHPAARAVTLRQITPRTHTGRVVIVAAGTSDMPVAEEARVTCDIMDLAVESVYDVGVAGLHRLLASRESIASADVVIAVAGMEGALPSVVGGLVSCPVIAVPTSTGYGASFGGVTALLAMLNSCASGVTVVNIDNGFGAAYAAARILKARTS